MKPYLLYFVKSELTYRNKVAILRSIKYHIIAMEYSSLNNKTLSFSRVGKTVSNKYGLYHFLSFTLSSAVTQSYFR